MGVPFCGGRLPLSALALSILLASAAYAVTGMAAQSEYAGFAAPEAGYEISESHIAFAGGADTASMEVTASDYAVYKYGYASCDGKAWQSFELSGNALGGAWLNGSVSAQLSLGPGNFSLTQSRLSVRRNFVVVYSCSRIEDAWDCHGGWQIWQFNASLEDPGPDESYIPSSFVVANLSFDTEVSSVDAGAVTSDPPSGSGTLGGGDSGNAPAWTENGHSGGAYTFDGVDDYIALPDIDLGDSRSYMVWFRLDDTSHYNSLISKTTQELDSEVDMFIPDGLVVRAEARTEPGVYGNLQGSTIITDNGWHMAAFTYDGSVMRVYLDGQPDGSLSYGSGIGENDMPYSIGYRRGTGGLAFEGAIDQVVVLNATLTPEQILAYYESTEVTIPCDDPQPSASCTIANGTGARTVACSNGQWVTGTCTVSSCDPGYEISGNSCVPESSSACDGMGEWDWSGVTTIPPFSWPTNVDIPGSGGWSTAVEYGANYQVEASSEHIREPGSQSMRMYMDADYPPVPESRTGGNFRAEIYLEPWHDQIPIGTEQWLGWSYYIPEDYQNDPVAEKHIFQWHVGGGSPPIGLWTSPTSGSSHIIISVLDRYANTYVLLEAGHWYDFVIHVVWDTESGGRGITELWINGDKVATIEGGTTYDHPDGGEPYGGTPKLGFYKYSWLNDDAKVAASADAGIDHEEVYIGPVRRLTRPEGDYAGAAGYDCVAPRGARPS